VAWGVYSQVSDRFNSVDEVARTALEEAHRREMAHPGDPVVITAGAPFGSPGSTNLLRIETLH